jgi:hypothetical protein
MRGHFRSWANSRFRRTHPTIHRSGIPSLTETIPCASLQMIPGSNVIQIQRKGIRWIPHRAVLQTAAKSQHMARLEIAT